MATAITFPAGNHKQVASVTCYTKANWADAWTAQPLLHCKRLCLCAAPAVSTAMFHWRIGDYLWPGARSFKTATTASVNPRQFVKVEVSGSDGRSGWTWYGIWKSATLGNDRQTFQADGLEALLAVPCVDAWAWDSSINAPAGGFWTYQGLRFNPDGVGNRSGNKSYTVNGQTVYAYHHYLSGETDIKWSTRDAVEYLLAMAAPKDKNGTVIFNWSASGLTNLPDFDAPELPTHGRTYLSLLHSLVSRFRLTSFTVNGADISFFTFAESAVTLTDIDGNSVGTIPANASQISVDIQRDQTANATISTEAAGIADKVTVFGDVRQSVFSLNGEFDATIVEGWDDAEYLGYLVGATLDPNYPPVNEMREREERDRVARCSDKWSKVFALFKTPEDWDQHAGDGEGGTKYPIAIDDETPASQVWQHIGLLEFQSTVPLLSGYEYTDTTIEDNDDVDGHRGTRLSTEGPYEPRPLMCFVKTTLAANSRAGYDLWSYGDQIGRSGTLEACLYVASGMASNADQSPWIEAPERKWSLRTRPVENELAIEVRVQGDQQHAIARDEFSSRYDAVRGAVDWADIIFTVCVNESRRVQVEYPETVSNPVGQVVREMKIDAPGHKRIYVVPGTVVGINPVTQELQKSTGGYLQDDRDKLTVIAQRAYEWHKTPRYSFQFSSNWVDSAVNIGHLVTAYTDHHGTYPVLSVVTEITVDFPVSEGKAVAPSATYVTAFGELDPLRAG